MSLWNLVVDNVLEDFLDWIYGQLVGFFGEFLGMINLMGAELFDMEWVQGIVAFFSYLAWALYIVGIIVSIFETTIEMQNGRGNIKDAALNALKGFMAVGLFTIVPVELYKFSITIQTGLTSAISSLSGSPDSISVLGMSIISMTIPGVGALFSTAIVILVGYAIIKVFFANLKRGGILLTMIAVGSLYMFSLPRGYADGFYSWCKQVVALCLTAFLQTVILIAGLITFNANMLLGIGLMLSATEVPRIAGHFGLDTSTKTNLTGTVHAAQGAINLVRIAGSAVAK